MLGCSSSPVTGSATSSGTGGSGGDPAGIGGAGGSTSTGGSGGAGNVGGSGGTAAGEGGEAGSSGAAGSGGSAGGGGQTAAPSSCEAPDWVESDFRVVHEVGPGRTFETPSDVPWESIAPSTLVKIFHREEPYRDKWVLNYPGTEAEPVVVLGVPTDGQLPVISGDDAVTRQELDFTGEVRSIIKVGTSSAPSNELPSYITVECLDIRSAKPDYGFSDKNGDPQSYAANAAAITIETGDHITIRNCALHDAGNGLFSAWQSSNVHVSGNHIYDNGNVDSIYEHNSYTESAGITFEFNHYGSLCAGCLGNNLKDRSAGTVVRYNWIENGNRQLDLVETDHDEIADHPLYGETFVYGNVLVEGDGEGNGQILHYGGDGSGQYRSGTLYFYFNTVVSTRSGNTTLARLSTEEESLAAMNNVFYATAGGSSFAFLDGSGTLELSGNFLPTGWRETHGTLTGMLLDSGNVEGSDPGFVDLDAQDLVLRATSPAIGVAGPLAPAAEQRPPNLQYQPHQVAVPRAGAQDAGAFESL